jgi:hypothetical protein
MRKLFLIIPVIIIAGLLLFNAPKAVENEVASLENDSAINLVSADTTMTTYGDPGGW